VAVMSFKGPNRVLPLARNSCMRHRKSQHRMCVSGGARPEMVRADKCFDTRIAYTKARLGPLSTNTRLLHSYELSSAEVPSFEEPWSSSLVSFLLRRGSAVASMAPSC
jgi:hypothetical protein